MSKKAQQTKREPQVVTAVVECDTSRLYGPIQDAIKYLQEIAAQYPADISLDEHWTGYEDMEMRFVYPRLETEEEVARRLEQARAKAALAADTVRREADRKAKQSQYDRLRRELGY